MLPIACPDPHMTQTLTFERPAGVNEGDGTLLLSVHPCHALFVVGRQRDRQVHSAISLWQITVSVSLNDSSLSSSSQISMRALQATCFPGPLVLRCLHAAPA